MGVSALPVTGFLPGMVMAYAGSVVPGGWLLCDGSFLLRSDYPQLFAAIGTTYNLAGDIDATRFRLPSLLGKVIVMRDAGQAEFVTAGISSGEKTHVLTSAETPGHSHQYGHTHTMTNANVDHAHNVYGTGAINSGYMNTNAAHQHEFNTDGNIYAQVWTTSTSHSHQGGGGTTSEQPWGGGAWATNHYHHGFTDWRDINHVHDYNHNHPSTNYATESPWAGNTASHAHTTNTQSSSTTDNGTGGGGGHNNLQPYLTMSYVIKV
jgi:microcystin-dependent protein